MQTQTVSLRRWWRVTHAILFKTTSLSIWQLWLHYRALHKHLDYIYLGHLCDALQLQECF